MLRELARLALGVVRDKLQGARIADDALVEGLGVQPRARATIAYLVLAANLMMYVTGLGVGVVNGTDASQDFFLTFANVGEEVEAGEFYRILSSTFLHDSFMHLASSCYALGTVAPAVERVLGPPTFLATYLLSGAAGSIATFLFVDSVTVGASGGIFGVIGALLAFLWKTRKPQENNELLRSIGGIVAVNLVLAASQDSAIDNLGHFAGLLTGLYLGWGLSPSVPAGSAALPPGAQRASEAGEAGGNPALRPAPLAAPDPARPPVLEELRRWAGYAAFAASLALVVAGAVVARTGQLPLPKGPDLAGFLGQGLV
ncbi:hypothetical protein WJX81_005552 [Elliptochloris bilobata]|uniref:Peptidase S54 rhomboid domain-containing protein n=1 Tax=Elliptochloris bilobata TaxID=381761 RepID=A0AAW1SH86_9CHLO